ncbi:MAG: hypothetical protein IKB02_00790 [Clostridia bacterium]|nr:hypothetical protein [Clostridia bacterium]
MITVQQAAEKWGVTPRRVQDLCKRGEIVGATMWHRSWMIPAAAEYPRRSAEEKKASASDDMPLPRKTPFLYMSDLYRTPGCAEESIKSLEYNHEAQVLFEAEIAYARGDIDFAYNNAKYLLGKHSGFYAVLSAGMILGICAMWRGDIEMWNKAKIHICEAPAKNDNDRDIMTLALTALDSMVYNTTSFPDWFKIGSFELLHPDAMPAAKVYYAKYLYALGYAVASGEYEIEGVKGLSLMKMLPYTIEPMISQAMADKTVIAEIYLRLTCATIYHNSGNDKEAIRHIDRAIALALPDDLFGLLAEYRRTLDSLLDDRLSLVSRDVYERVMKLYKKYIVGWSALSGAVRNRNLITTLTTREREVAKLAAFGMSNADIAERLHISLASVKQSIRTAIYKSGVENKAALASIL